MTHDIYGLLCEVIFVLWIFYDAFVIVVFGYIRL